MGGSIELTKAYGIRINSTGNSNIDMIKKVIGLSKEGQYLESDDIKLKHLAEYHFDFDEDILAKVIYFGAGNIYDIVSLVVYVRDTIKTESFGPYSSSYTFDTIYRAITANDQTNEFDNIINHTIPNTQKMDNIEEIFLNKTGINFKWHWTLFWIID